MHLQKRPPICIKEGHEVLDLTLSDFITSYILKKSFVLGGTVNGVIHT